MQGLRQFAVLLSTRCRPQLLCMPARLLPILPWPWSVYIQAKVSDDYLWSIFEHATNYAGIWASVPDNASNYLTEINQLRQMAWATNPMPNQPVSVPRIGAAAVSITLKAEMQNYF